MGPRAGWLGTGCLARSGGAELGLLPPSPGVEGVAPAGLCRMISHGLFPREGQVPELEVDTPRALRSVPGRMRGGAALTLFRHCCVSQMLGFCVHVCLSVSLSWIPGFHVCCGEVGCLSVLDACVLCVCVCFTVLEGLDCACMHACVSQTQGMWAVGLGGEGVLYLHIACRGYCGGR